MRQLLCFLTAILFIVSCVADDENIPFESNFEETEVEDFSQEMSDFEHETLEYINAFRAEQNNCGGDVLASTEPLMWHPNLDDAAEAHARDMFENDKLTHEGSDGSNLGDRLEDADYNAAYYGENVAKGPPTPKEVVEAFKNSPSHCKVMSSPNFKQVGIAKVGKYWVFDFGTER